MYLNYSFIHLVIDKFKVIIDTSLFYSLKIKTGFISDIYFK